jgi:hypothetical protein
VALVTERAVGTASNDIAQGIVNLLPVGMIFWDMGA